MPIIETFSPRVFGVMKKVPMDGTIPNQKNIYYASTQKAYVISSGYGNDKIGYSYDGTDWKYVGKGTNGNQLHDGKMAALYGYLLVDVVSEISNGQTTSSSNMYLYADGGFFYDNLEQKTLPVSEVWADVAAWPSENQILSQTEAGPCYAIVGGRHIMVGETDGTWTDVEITTSMVPNADSKAISVAAMSSFNKNIDGKFIILMSEQQGRTNVIPVLYGNTVSGWTYKEFELDDSDVLPAPIAEDNCYIKENGYMYVQGSDGFYGLIWRDDEPYAVSKTRVSAEDWTYPITIKAIGDGAIVYGVYEKEVNGVMTQYGCVIDLNVPDISKGISEGVEGFTEGVSIAIGESNICIGTNNADYMYYLNYYDPSNMVFHNYSSFSDIEDGAREDWMTFVDKVKAGKFQEATDEVSWREKERVAAPAFNNILNFVELVELMKDKDFKILTSPRIMTLGSPDPRFDVFENQMYFYQYELKE